MYTKRFSIAPLTPNSKAMLSFDRDNFNIESKNKKFFGLIASTQTQKHTSTLKSISDIDVKKYTSIGQLFLGTLIIVACIGILIGLITTIIIENAVSGSLNDLLSMYNSNPLANITGSVSTGIQAFTPIQLLFIFVIFSAATSVLLLFGIGLIINSTKIYLSYKEDGIESAIYVTRFELSRMESFACELMKAKKSL